MSESKHVNSEIHKPENPYEHEIPDIQAARLSRRQAALILGVIPPTLDKLAETHRLTISQIPGHNRRYFLRSEIEALAAAAISTGARA